MKSLEERVEEAIIARFFEPSWIVSTGAITDPSTGMMRTEPVMSQIPSEMSVVARAIYDQVRDEIVRKVIESMDIDAIVAEWSPIIAKDVIIRLNADDRSGWLAKPGPSERRKMMDKVYENVATEFGRQAVEHLRKTGGLMAVLEVGE